MHVCVCVCENGRCVLGSSGSTTRDAEPRPIPHPHPQTPHQHNPIPPTAPAPQNPDLPGTSTPLSPPYTASGTTAPPLPPPRLLLLPLPLRPSHPRRLRRPWRLWCRVAPVISHVASTVQSVAPTSHPPTYTHSTHTLAGRRRRRRRCRYGGRGRRRHRPLGRRQHPHRRWPHCLSCCLDVLLERLKTGGAAWVGVGLGCWGV